MAKFCVKCTKCNCTELCPDYIPRPMRTYPDGRIGAEDEGELRFAIAADVKHNVVVVRFPTPVGWLAFPMEDCEKFIQLLRDKMCVLEENQKPLGEDEEIDLQL